MSQTVAADRSIMVPQAVAAVRRDELIAATPPPVSETIARPGMHPTTSQTAALESKRAESPGRVRLRHSVRKSAQAAECNAVQAKGAGPDA